MPNPSTHEGSLTVTERFSCKYFDPPAQSIADASVKSDANIGAGKLEHQHEIPYAYGSPTTTAAANAIVSHTARAEGSIVGFRAGCVTPCLGNATITLDLKKNGTTVLSSTFSLSSAQAAYASLDAAVSGVAGTLAAGDVLSIHVTVNAGTGTLGAGLFGQIIIRTKAA